MKTIFLSTILSLSFIANAVAQTSDEDLFDESIEYFEEEEFDEAAKGFFQLMVKYPKSSLLPRAHYNLALTRYRMKDYQGAKKLFQEILGQSYNERDENCLMEPYALYKHHSCRQLAAMALEEKDYKSAEAYIKMFDKKYPYQHFCGNEWSAYDMYKAVMISQVYEGTGQVKKALEELLPYMFANALASNQGVLDELSEILQKHYTQEQIHQEFKRSLESLRIKQNKREISASIDLYGVSVPVSDLFVEGDGEVSEKERYQKAVEENPLFKKFL